MIFRKLLQKKAVTMTELLVVLAIVTLLATMAVPVYVNQLNRAKVATAQAETNEISKAMQAVAITHGMLVPIHILDNVPNSDSSFGGSSGSVDDFDNITSPSQRFLLDVNIPLDEQTGNNQPNLGQTGNPRVLSLIDTWQGPFLNPKRVRYVGASDANPFSGEIDEDLVVDPWGNPYRVYAANGLLGNEGVPSGPYTTNSQLSINYDDLQMSTTKPEEDRFDRFAILSYGSNGVSNFASPIDQGDDVFSTFVINNANESRYQFY